MTNKIGPVEQGLIGKIGNKVEEAGVNRRVSREAGTAAGSATDLAPPQDTVELTSSARLLERLEKSLAALPAVDSARVAEIKSAIENGEYQIDADAIAEAMIRFERSLGD